MRYIYMIHHIILFMRMMTPNMLMEMCWPQVCAQIKKLYDILLGNARIVFLFFCVVFFSCNTDY